MLKILFNLFKVSVPCFEINKIDTQKKLILSSEDTKSFVDISKNKHQKVTFSEFGERLTPNTQFRF